MNSFKLSTLLFLVMSAFATHASAVIIDQDGISYSCSPIESPHQGGSCKKTCVKYCANYDAYPFEDRCRQYATECGANASVDTICSQYDKYPFEDRCLQKEDVVNTDTSCP